MRTLIYYVGIIYSVVTATVVRRGHVMHGGSHMTEAWCNKTDCRRLHHHGLGVGVAGAHSHRLGHCHVNNYLTVVGLFVVAHFLNKVMVGASIVDLAAMNNDPDVSANVNKGNEQKDELNNGCPPSLSTVTMRHVAGVDHASNGWEEDVQEEAAEAGTA